MNCQSSKSQSRTQDTRGLIKSFVNAFLSTYFKFEYLSKANQSLVMTFCVSVQVVFYFSIYSWFFFISLKILSLLFFLLIKFVAMWNLFWLNAAYTSGSCLFLIASFIRKSSNGLYRALKMIKGGIKLHFPVITVGEILLLGIQSVFCCWWTASLLLVEFYISLFVISPFF